MSGADHLAIWCRRCRSVCEYGCDCPGGSPQWPLVTRHELGPKIYLAHPITDYGTARQKLAVLTLEKNGWMVENPDQPHHLVGYKTYGMTYFMDVVSACDALAFMPFRGADGAIGAGVAKEIERALFLNLKVFEIDEITMQMVQISSNWRCRVLSVEGTRAMLSNLTP